MKQSKRKKSAAAPLAALDADAAMLTQNLPDADYVEQLLADPAQPDAALTIAVADAPLQDGVISLPTQCLMRDAVEYRQRLLDCLQMESVSIDVAAVERIDTAFMQVLLAFVCSRANNNAGVAWLNVNAVFAEAAAMLGLQAVLMVPAMSEAA